MFSRLDSQILTVLGKHLDITDESEFIPLVDDLATLLQDPPKVRRNKKKNATSPRAKRAGNPYARFVKVVSGLNKGTPPFDPDTITFSPKAYAPSNDKAAQRWEHIKTHFEFDGDITLGMLHSKVCDGDLIEFLGNGMVKASIMWGMLPDSAKSEIDNRMLQMLSV